MVDMSLRMEHRSAFRAAVCILGESLVVFGPIILIEAWQNPAIFSFGFTPFPYLNAAIFTVLCQVSLYVCGLYPASMPDDQKEDRPQYDSNIQIAAVADTKAPVYPFTLQPETAYVHLQNCNELVHAAPKYKTRKVIVCQQTADTLTPDFICDLKHKGLRLRSEDAIYEAAYGRRDIDRLDPKKLVFSRSFQHSIRRLYKPVGDIAIASMLLLLSSPVIIFAALKLKKGDMSLIGPCSIGPQQVSISA